MDVYLPVCIVVTTDETGCTAAGSHLDVLIEMKVKQLIEELNKLEPNDVIVLASDEEGNDFHKLYDIHNGFFEDITAHRLEPIDQWDEGASRAVVLWPQ